MKMIFLGPPGVGKGTYASRLAPKMGILHISTGDLFREEIKEGTELGKKAKEYMDEGNLVPDELVIDMLKHRIEKPDAKNGFILDGFPRTIPQAEALDKAVDMDVVVNIKQKDHVLIEKISARRVCKKCGEIYNLAYIKEEGLDMPPVLPKIEGKCDKCGGKLLHRDDDKEEVVRDRLEVYKKQTAPLIDFYKKKGLIVDVVVIGGPEVMVDIIEKAIKNRE
jgi:adenylate kinase